MQGVIKELSHFLMEIMKLTDALVNYVSKNS